MDAPARQPVTERDIRQLRAIANTCDDRDRTVSSVNVNYSMGTHAGPRREIRPDTNLEAAADLFYREGIRAVGVDAVIAHSGVAKISLYRNFAGKDELVAAFLNTATGLYWEWSGQGGGTLTPRRARPDQGDLRGCRQADGPPGIPGLPLHQYGGGFPDGGHPGRVVALTNKHELRAACGRWPKLPAPMIRACWPTSFCLCWKGPMSAARPSEPRALDRGQRRRRPMLLWMPHARRAEPSILNYKSMKRR